MPQLSNPKHEAFAQFVATGKSAAEACICAGFSKKGARQAASRLLTRVDVATRVAELVGPIKQKIQETIENAVDDDIRSRAGRIEALNKRRLGLLRVIEARAIYPEHQDVPGGNTGYVVTSYKGVARSAVKTHQVDVALLQELRETEKQIAIELNQWQEPDSDGPRATEISYEWQSSSASSDTTHGTAKPDSMKAESGSRVIPVQ